MRKLRKTALLMACFLVFAAMAMGSGTSDSEGGKSISSDKKAAENEKVTIEEQVIVDQGGVKITAKEYVRDSIWGDGIKVLIENDTPTDITVGCEALIVNNYMISDLFSETVASGKKSNETIYLSTSQLKAAGIDTVGQIEAYLYVYEKESWEKMFDTDCITIKTSAFDNMDTTANSDGTELYNANGIRIVGKTVDDNSFWGAAVLLYIENTSDKNVGVSVDDMSINGFMTNPLFSTTVYSGKKAIDDITIFSSDLEKNGITSIDTVELKFHIYDKASYSTIADSDVIKFSAK
ncbi:MAG: hypothetical protein PUE71_07175 [Clostridia bacterium]|nr:hypothetical protein [Clostridia bacterium]